MDNLVEKILNYRAKHNLSVEKFAKLCNVSSTTIYSVEKGYSNLNRLARQKILNVIEKEGD